MTATSQSPQYLLETRISVSPPALRTSSQISRPPDPAHHISVNVSQPAAAWIRSAIGRVEDLTALAPGWDGYLGQPIDAGIALRAVTFLLDHAYPTLAEPSIVPLSDGGIQIEWHQGGIDLEIFFGEQDSGSFLEDAEQGLTHDGSLADGAGYLTGLISRLAASA